MEIARGGILAGLVISFFVQYYATPRGINDVGAGSTLGNNNWFDVSDLVIASVNIVFLAVDIVCVVMLLQLFMFHIRLRREGITVSMFNGALVAIV